MINNSGCGIYGRSKKNVLYRFLGIVLGIYVVRRITVCYRTQNKMRNRVRTSIVQTQQDIAVAQADFASYVRPEILRNLVTSVYPRAEVISFHKHVSVYDLPTREETAQQ